MSQDLFVKAFREAAPYIHYLRGKILVLGIASPLLSGQRWASLAADVNLLASLGIKLVLVHGAEQQISHYCSTNQHDVVFHQHRRVCDEQVLEWAKQLCGQLQFDLQSALSLGMVQSPQNAKRLRVVNANVITAKPLGVLEGVDMGYAGEVRKVDTQAIHDYLAQDSMVLISPIANSLSGQAYLLSMANVAAEVATALQAEKLIYITEWDGIINHENQCLHELTLPQAQALLSPDNPQTPILNSSIHALKNHVSRVQIISGSLNGGLLRELFTREGVGTSIANAPFVSIRAAQEWDIADMLALIRPLEEKGILMQRGQGYLAEHIQEFSILEHDRQINGCVALKTFDDTPNAAELACLVVSPQARDGGYGDLLLKHIILQAKSLNKNKLFALSTNTSDWFVERGFRPCPVSDLPPQRQAQYDANGRQSRVFVMDLV